MDEIRERRRKQTIKVLITEGLMVVAVILLVVLTTLSVVGYNLNVNEEISVERTGLLALRSVPTGAQITIDGETIFSRTNMSRTTVEGEHEIVLSKDGYDSWKKNIEVTAGLYRRVEYPRLFLAERVIEKVADFSGIEIYSVAPDENTMIAIDVDGGKWSSYKINEAKLTETALNVTGVFEDGVTTQVEVKDWSGNSEKVVLKVDGEWVLFNVRKPAESVNLSKKYGMEFSEVRFENDAGSKVIVLEGGRIREISLDGGGISEVFVKDVEKFENYREEIVFVRRKETGKEVGVYKIGEKGSTTIFATENGEAEIFATIGEYFGEDFVGIAFEGKMSVLSGKLPSFGETEVKMEVVAETEVFFPVSEMEVRGFGELIVGMNREGTEMAVFDAEVGNIRVVELETEMRWVDEYLVGTVEGGKLFVLDFDGENKREIVEKDVNNRGEVRISSNEKWMYYLGVDGGFYRVEIFK